MTERPPPTVRAVGYAVAAWCLGFAGVSLWLAADLVAHPEEAAARYAADAAGLVVLSLLVRVLKLAGAGVALAAVLARPGWPGRRLRLLGMALWGAFGLLALAGAALFGVLAVWFHRRHRLRWTAAVAGLAGAPLLLGLVLAVVPAILGRWGLLPT